MSCLDFPLVQVPLLQPEEVGLYSPTGLGQKKDTCQRAAERVGCSLTVHTEEMPVDYSYRY